MKDIKYKGEIFYENKTSKRINSKGKGFKS